MTAYPPPPPTAPPPSPPPPPPGYGPPPPAYGPPPVYGAPYPMVYATLPSSGPTDEGLRLLRYGALLAILGIVIPFVGGLFAFIGAILGLVGFLKMYGDRQSLGPEHADSVKSSLLFYILGIVLSIVGAVGLAIFLVTAVTTGVLDPASLVIAALALFVAPVMWALGRFYLIRCLIERPQGVMNLNIMLITSAIAGLVITAVTLVLITSTWAAYGAGLIGVVPLIFWYLSLQSAERNLPALRARLPGGGMPMVVVPAAPGGFVYAAPPMAPPPPGYPPPPPPPGP